MENFVFFERFRKAPRTFINSSKTGLSKLYKNTSAEVEDFPKNRTKTKSKRKKKIGDSRFPVFFIAVVFSLASLIILIVLLPVSLLSLWIVCSLNYTFIRRANVHGAISDFWLTEKQAKGYLSAAVPFYQARERLRDAYDQGTAMGLTKRNNRRFDEGSQLGKELNSIIESNEKTVRRYRYDVLIMGKKPLSRWMIFKKAYINSRSYGAGFVTWLVATVFSIYLFSDDFAFGFKNFFLFPFLALEDLPGMLEGFFDFQLRFGMLTMHDWIMVLIPTIASYFGYYITGLLIRNRAGKFSPEPPMVTVENALQHIRNPRPKSIQSRPVR
jgi:hypothetical protein